MNVSFFASKIGNSLFKLIGYSVFFLFINNGYLLAQNQDFCGTLSNAPDFLKSIKSSETKSAPSSYTIGIFFHIMRRTNGTGGQTQQEVNTALSTLTADYQPYNIYISLLGTDEIKNDTYYNYNYLSDFEDAYQRTDADGDGKFDVFNVNTHINAIDIYLFADDKMNFGLAANIPGTALVIGGNGYGANFPSSHVLSHELGHCLGLYHTFHGTVPSDGAGSCPELVNESNGTTCGDFVADTPADPAYIKDCGTQSTCTWNCSNSYADATGAHYSPNTHLVMSYTFPSCMTIHTSGQVTRMFNTIANSCLLYFVLVNTISGPTPPVVCSSGATFTVNNVPDGCSVSWTCSTNITFDNQIGNPKVFTANGNGSGWVQATINSTTCGSVTLPQYSVVVGFPTPAITAIKVSGPGEPTHYDFTATFYTGATYNWYVNNSFNSNGPNTFDWYFQCNKTSTIKCKLVNSCGTSAFSNSISKTGECRTLNELTLSPNPASNTVLVNIISEIPDSTTNLLNSSTLITQTTYTVSILNSFGTQFLSTQVTGTPFSLPVGNLTDGTYIVTVNDGKNKYSKLLVVKH